MGLGGLARRDVGVRADHAQRLAVGRSGDHFAPVQDPDPAVVLGPHAELADEVVGLAVDAGLVLALDTGQIVRMDSPRPFVGRAANLVFAVAEDLFPSLRIQGAAGRQVGIPDAVSGALEGELPARFAVAQDGRIAPVAPQPPAERGQPGDAGDQRRAEQEGPQLAPAQAPVLVDAEPRLVKLVVGAVGLGKGQAFVDARQQVGVALAHRECEALREADPGRERLDTRDAAIADGLHPGELADQHGLVLAAGEQAQALLGGVDEHQAAGPALGDRIVVRQVAADHDDGLAGQVVFCLDAPVALAHEDGAAHHHIRGREVGELASLVGLREVQQHIDVTGLETAQQFVERPDAQAVGQALLVGNGLPELDRETIRRGIGHAHREWREILLAADDQRAGVLRDSRKTGQDQRGHDEPERRAPGQHPATAAREWRTGQRSVGPALLALLQ